MADMRREPEHNDPDVRRHPIGRLIVLSQPGRMIEVWRSGKRIAVLWPDDAEALAKALPSAIDNARAKG